MIGLAGLIPSAIFCYDVPSPILPTGGNFLLAFPVDIPLAGSLVNSLSIAFGGALGLAVGSRLPGRYSEITFQALGLFTGFIGLSMALKSTRILILAFSLVAGSLLGEALQLESRVNRLGESVKKRIRSKNERFGEGMIAASLLFCTGSMAILGSFEEGLHGTRTILLTKSLIDGFAAIAFATTFGVGIVASAVPLFLYQGALTLFAGLLEPVLVPAVVNEITATGGVLMIGMGITILGIKPLRIVNMLPSLVIAGILAVLSG